MDTHPLLHFPQLYAPFWDHTPMHTHPGTHRHTLISVVFLPTEFIRFQMPLGHLLGPEVISPGCFKAFSCLRLLSTSPCQKWGRNLAGWHSHSLSSRFCSVPLQATLKLHEITPLMYVLMACLIHKNIRARGLSLSHAQRMFQGPEESMISNIINWLTRS